jgi:N-acetylmuramoyl-L-alanine amidase
MKNKILNRLKRMISGSAALFVYLLLFSLTCYATKKIHSKSFKFKTVIIDPGHGVKPKAPQRALLPRCITALFPQKGM